jgi:hypothetical protein
MREVSQHRRSSERPACLIWGAQSHAGIYLSYIPWSKGAGRKVLLNPNFQGRWRK